MGQTSQLTATLKRCLRARGLTYADVARTLDLSESSVKRLFSAQTFTVKRLEDICELLEMSIFELTKLAASHEDVRTQELSVEQEQALVADPVLLCYFYLLITGWKPGRIGQRLALDQHARQNCLEQLAELKLIDLQPRNRVRLRVDPRTRWRRYGPIRSRYEGTVKKQFLDIDFAEADEALELNYGELSAASIQVILRRVARLADEFAELVELDRNLPQDEKRGFGLLLAARSWTFWNIIGSLPEMKSGRT